MTSVSGSALRVPELEPHEDMAEGIAFSGRPESLRKAPLAGMVSNASVDFVKPRYHHRIPVEGRDVFTRLLGSLAINSVLGF